jgi:hypothetical protein
MIEALQNCTWAWTSRNWGALSVYEFDHGLNLANSE